MLLKSISCQRGLGAHWKAEPQVPLRSLESLLPPSCCQPISQQLVAAFQLQLDQGLHKQHTKFFNRLSKQKTFQFWSSSLTLLWFQVFILNSRDICCRHSNLLLQTASPTLPGPSSAVCLAKEAPAQRRDWFKGFEATADRVSRKNNQQNQQHQEAIQGRRKPLSRGS